MADTLNNPGGRVNWTTNQRVTSDELDLVGDISVQSLMHTVAWLTRGCITPRSGFPGRNCWAKRVTNELTVRVYPGMGMYYDSAETDVHGTHYKPIVVSDLVDTVLSAHDAANPRIDIICLAPALLEDTSTVEQFKDPGTGALGVAAVNIRSRWTYDLVVVEGTPAATPQVPGTTSGYLKVCDVLVPAVSGNVTVTDTRPILALGVDWNADPPEEYVGSGGFVPGTGGEMAVTAQAVPSMVLSVAAGEAVHGPYTLPTSGAVSGTGRIRMEAGSVTLDAAHATLDRIDIVYVTPVAGGLFGVAKGTADANPAANKATLEAWQVPLAEAYVAAADTSITNGNITDVRVREPFDTDQIRDGSITAVKLATPTILLACSDGGTIVADHKRLQVFIKNTDGDAMVYASIGPRVLFELINATTLEPAVITATIAVEGTITTTGTNKVLAYPDITNGHCVIDLNPADVGGTLLLVKVTTIDTTGPSAGGVISITAP